MTETANIDAHSRWACEKPMSIDDAALVKRYRSGDSAALETLIIKYQNRIYNIVLKICANRDDAAELTQETFVKVIEKIEQFQGRSGFYTWVFRIAVNLTLNYCKRGLKIRFTSLDAEIDRADSRVKGALRQFLTDDNVTDPARIAGTNELGELAVKALMGLDDTHRAVIVLRDIEGMSYADISQVLEMNLGTVKSRLSRARNNLREILEAFLK